jgi:hypothetical protein
MIRRLMVILGVVVAGVSWGWAKSPSIKDLEAEFKAECDQLNHQRIKGTGETIVGKDSWLVLGTEMNYITFGPFWGPDALRSNPKKPGAADPLAAILDFHAQLAKHGVELLLMPVPTRELVYPEAVLGADKLPKGVPPRLDPTEVEFYHLLRSKGINVLDLMPIFLAERYSEHGRIFVPSESHWTGYGIVVAAHAAAREIESRHWARKVPKAEFSAEWTSKEIDGHILKSAQEHGAAEDLKPDTIWIRVIKQKTAKGWEKFDWKQPDSPVVIIGDSNTFWWSREGGGLPEELSYELGFPVELVPTALGGATNARLNLMRRIQSEPTYLSRKKLLLWCFTSRGFVHTGDGWSLVPLDGAPAQAATPEPK